MIKYTIVYACILCTHNIPFSVCLCAWEDKHMGGNMCAHALQRSEVKLLVVSEVKVSH